MKGTPGFIEYVYRMRFGASCLLMLVLIFPVLFVLLILEIPKLSAFPNPLELLLVLAVPVAISLLTSLLLLLFSTGVGPKGIRSYRDEGSYREIPWERMTRVSHLSLFNLKFIRFTGDKWYDTAIIMVLGGWPELLQAFDKYAPPGHTIRQTFMEIYTHPDAPKP